MKKKLAIFFLILFMGVGTIFTGCNTTDLSEINAEIDSLKQQIISLNQTITDLQTRLNESEENQDELLLDLTTAKGQLDNLQNKINGSSSAYSIGQKVTYCNSGIKFFDLTITSSYFNSNSLTHVLEYIFTPSFDGIQINNNILNFSAFLYSPSEQKSYSTNDINSNEIITFELNVPDDLRSGLVYLYVGNTLFAVYDVNFDEIVS